MKKTLALLLAAAMLFTVLLAGCGGNSQDTVFEIPETGDNHPVAVMLVLMAASICGMGMTMAALKKEEDES